MRHIFVLLVTLALIVGCNFRSGVEVGIHQYSGWGNGHYARIEKNAISVFSEQSVLGRDDSCVIKEDSSDLIERWVSLVPAQYDHLSAVEFLGDCADEPRREVSMAWWRGDNTFRSFSVRWSLSEECRPSPVLPNWLESISKDFDELEQTIQAKCEKSNDDT